MTTFVFEVKNVPAALYKALGGFATNGVNMTKLESYQQGASFSATMFFADIVGAPGDPAIDRALEELAFHCKELRMLGSYRRPGRAAKPQPRACARARAMPPLRPVTTGNGGQSPRRRAPTLFGATGRRCAPTATSSSPRVDAARARPRRRLGCRRCSSSSAGCSARSRALSRVRPRARAVRARH